MAQIVQKFENEANGANIRSDGRNLNFWTPVSTLFEPLQRKRQQLWDLPCPISSIMHRIDWKWWFLEFWQRLHFLDVDLNKGVRDVVEETKNSKTKICNYFNFLLCGCVDTAL